MKCKKQQQERIFKNSISVDVKSKKILSIKVTNEHVHDNKALPEMVEDITKSNNMTATIVKLVADDGDYDSNDIFRCPVDNGIMPCIKV